MIKTTEIGFAGVEGALRHFGGVTEEVLLAEQMTIRLARDHGFADSPLEEAGFEPSVPLYILTVSDPLLVGPVTVPFAKRKSSVGDRVPSVRRLLPPPSIPGHRLGALRWRVTGVA